MQSPLYLLSWVAGLCACWFVWNFGIKRTFLDLFRERLFALRFELFRLGMSDELPFDSDTYRTIETLLSGLLRFGHRITLSTYIFSSIEQERAKKSKDYTDVSLQIALKISRLEPKTRTKLMEILSGVRLAVVLYMGFTSLFCLTYLAALTVGRLLGLKRSNEAQERVAFVIEREAYRVESRRSLGAATA